MPFSIVNAKKILEGVANVKKILAIASGKGGVGKSTVAMHLAAAFAHLGQKVGILDADLYGPSLRRMVRESFPPKEAEGRWTPAYSASGMALMTLAYFRDSESPLAYRAPLANQFITSFLKEVDWGELDWLVIDFPPGTGDIPLTLVQSVPIKGALLVTTPQEVALSDVAKALSLFKMVDTPVLGVIENMSYFTPPGSTEKFPLFGQGGGKRFASFHRLPFLGEIPIDPQLGQASDKGQPLVEEKPHANSARLFMEIAATLLDGVGS